MVSKILMQHMEQSNDEEKQNQTATTLYHLNEFQ